MTSFETTDDLIRLVRMVVREELSRSPLSDRAAVAVLRGKPLVYFIRASNGGPIKIGVAERPFKRLAELQVASPVPLELLAVSHGGVERERQLHSAFTEWRLHGEWFEPCPALLDLIVGLQSNAPTTPSKSAVGASTEGA